MIPFAGKKRLRGRRFLFLGSLLLLIAGVTYWVIATDKFADTKNRKAAYAVSALDFLTEFAVNDTAANKKYTDQIVAVSGIVNETEAADTTVNIKFVDTASGSYIIFAFQEQHLSEAKALKVGDSVAIKGSCSGSIYSEILGTRVITFKRAALVTH